jgi:hypothetical protein
MERTSTTVNMNVLESTSQRKVEINQKAAQRIARKEHEFQSGAGGDEFSRGTRACQNDACMNHTSTHYPTPRGLQSIRTDREDNDMDIHPDGNVTQILGRNVCTFGSKVNDD